MTWSDRISFVLTEALTIKRVTPLDVIKDESDTTAQNEDERFDADMMLMTGELSKMLTDLVAALGGEVQKLAAQEAGGISGGVKAMQPCCKQCQFSGCMGDRKSVGSGKSVQVRVEHGGRRIIKKNKRYITVTTRRNKTK